MKDTGIDWSADEFEIDEQIVASGPSERIDNSYFDARKMLSDVLEELNEQGKLDFWLIKDPQIRKFWEQHQERKRVQKIHEEALEKLRTQFTDEELRSLRIRLPGS